MRACTRPHTYTRVHGWGNGRRRNTCRTIAVTRSVVATTRRSRRYHWNRSPGTYPWSALLCTTASLHPATVHSRGFPREWDFTGEINSALLRARRKALPRARVAPRLNFELNFRASASAGMMRDCYHKNTHLPLFVRCISRELCSRTA